MRKATGFLLSIIFLLSGIILGFFIEPVKKGIYCGNNNGNNNSNANNPTYNREKPYEIKKTADGRVRYVYNPTINKK